MRVSRVGREAWLAICGAALCAACRTDAGRPAVTRDRDLSLAEPLFAAPPRPVSLPPVAGLTAEQRRGQVIYDTFCWSCHGLYGHGDGPAARGFRGELPELGEDLSRASVDEVVRRLRRPAGAAADSGPPVWHALGTDEVRAAVAYVATFAPPRTGGNPAAGRLIYQSYCVQCHGARGAGDGRLAATFSPPPADLRSLDLSRQVRQVFAKLKAGGTARHGSLMPGWGSAFGDRQLWDVMAYLRVLTASR